MKALKIILLLLVLLLIAVACICFVQLSSAKVNVISVSTTGVSAANNPDDFSNWSKEISDGTFFGTCFQTAPEWKSAQEYVLITYSVTLQNDCLVPIEQIELQLQPQEEDIAQFGKDKAITLAAGKKETVEITVLSEKNTDTVRDLVLSWYLWGKPFTMQISSGKN